MCVWSEIRWMNQHKHDSTRCQTCPVYSLFQLSRYAFDSQHLWQALAKYHITTTKSLNQFFLSSVTCVWSKILCKEIELILFIIFNLDHYNLRFDTETINNQSKEDACITLKPLPHLKPNQKTLIGPILVWLDGHWINSEEIDSIMTGLDTKDVYWVYHSHSCSVSFDSQHLRKTSVGSA